MRTLYSTDRQVDDRLVQAMREVRHIVDVAKDFEEGLELARSADWDVLVCDLRRADANSISIFRAAAPSALLIAIASAASDLVRAGMLRAGADAVFSRPVAFRELHARMEAMLRPARRLGGRELEFELRARQQAVAFNGELIALSPGEYRLLSLFAAREGEVLSFEQILAAVWGDEGDPARERIHAYIYRLRGKLEKGRPWRLFHALRGQGYRFAVIPRDGGSTG